MTDDLVAFLRARLKDDEDTAEATRQASLSWRNFDMDGELRDDANAGTVCIVPADEDRAHIARWDPQRVIAEVAAKRKLIARGGPFCTSGCGDPGNEPMNPDTNWTTPLEHHCDCGAYEAAKVLALPYADHPDYDEAIKT